MNRQKKHILLWIAALLVLLCAWTVTASAVLIIRALSSGVPDV